MSAIRVVNVRGRSGRRPIHRPGVCYVGRACAGWPASPWGNPFKPNLRPAKGDTLFKCDTCGWWGLLGASRKRQEDFGCLGNIPGGCGGYLRSYPHAEVIADLLVMFRSHASKQSDSWWMDLWEACDHGRKPLGCWCINATHGDGQPVVCHAQILAEELHKRFVREES